MDYSRTLPSILLFGSLLVGAHAAFAGCGGDSFTLNFEEIKSECGPQIDSVTTHSLEHSLDRHVARNERRYDVQDVVATKVQLYALEEMAGAVRSLVTRSERLSDPAEADEALRVAEDTLLSLPIAEYFTIEDFGEDNRNHAAVKVPLETLLQYLRDVGTPENLVEAVEDAADDC